MNTVTHLYEPLHPAILRLVRQVVKAAHEAGIRVAMCGEMAGEPLYVPMLLGLELDDLSMNVLSIFRVKKILRVYTFRECKELVEASLSFPPPRRSKNWCGPACARNSRRNSAKISIPNHPIIQ